LHFDLKVFYKGWDFGPRQGVNDSNRHPSIGPKSLINILAALKMHKIHCPQQINHNMVLSFAVGIVGSIFVACQLSCQRVQPLTVFVVLCTAILLDFSSCRFL